MAGGPPFEVGVEFSGGALFTYFVKGAGFSSSLRVTSDTEDNPTKITDANSHAPFFIYDAFGRVTQARYGSPAWSSWQIRCVRGGRSVRCTSQKSKSEIPDKTGCRAGNSRWNFFE
jgi:YD repeat-containing protein